MVPRVIRFERGRIFNSRTTVRTSAGGEGDACKIQMRSFAEDAFDSFALRASRNRDVRAPPLILPAGTLFLSYLGLRTTFPRGWTSLNAYDGVPKYKFIGINKPGQLAFFGART
jgi:hypothetical protein